MTPKQKQAQLVERLYKKTMSRSLNWRIDPKFGICADISGLVVNLTDSRSGNDSPLEIVRVISPHDEAVLESFTDEDLEGEPASVPDETWWTFMEIIREAAQRQASGADDAIDSILDELGED